MNSSSRKLLRGFLPVLIIFIFVSGFSVLFTRNLVSWGVEPAVVIGGNLLLFLVTLFSFLLYRKGLLASNTHAFLRNVYSGMLLKLFTCIIAAFLYIASAGKDVNRAGIFVLMFLYLLYTFLEITSIMKISRQIKQGKNA